MNIFFKYLVQFDSHYMYALFSQNYIDNVGRKRSYIMSSNCAEETMQIVVVESIKITSIGKC